MKKLFTILAVLVLSLAGVFVGCGEGKYANAEIEFESHALSGDVLTIGYNNSVDITAKTTGVKGINSAVNFVCSDTEALEFTGLSNSEEGTTVTIKAKKPTYGDNYFILKAISVETSNVYKEIKVKVILPIQGIDFGGAVLAVSPSTPLRLFEYVKFYPQTPYVTNQKEVVYDITNYGLNNASSISIDETGLLTVSDDVIDNLTTDVECLEVTVISLANRGISYSIKINVVKDLKDTDITIESPQLSYNKAPIADKQELILFTNSEDYYREQVIVEVISSQDISIIPEKFGNTNIVEITQMGAITKTPIDGISFKNKATFEIRAKSSADVCTVKFKVKTLNIDNPLEFNFSDATAISVKTSALPKMISLKQDADAIAVGQTMAVYNEYVATENTSNFGTKIVPNVSSNSATSVSEANKYVKIELLSTATDNDAMSEFVLTDIKGNVIDTTEGFIEMLSNNGFYLKAKDEAVGKTFKLVITTQIKEFISYASGGSPAVDDEIVVAEYYISANYGVKEITFDKESYITKLYKPNSPEYTETLITFTVNENADIAGMVAEYDPTVLSVTKIDTFSYLIIGNSIATTDFAIIAKNGFTKRVVVKVVDPLTSASLSVDNPTSSQVITEVDYFGKQLLSVSAKTGGRFNLYVSTAPSVSGILKTEYESTDEVVAVVSGSGIISTKNAGSTMITVKIQYYEFTYGADGYATYSVETQEISFELTVFTPTRSIKLSRNVATVYSSDSLGYEYSDYSVVEVYAEISPVTATIYNDENAVSYQLLNNNDILVQEGARGRYRATLPQGVNEATVLIVVTVSEYGSSVSLVCTVTVLRAPQVEEIVIENLNKVNTGYYLLDMKEDERFTLEITLNPENVFISDLLISLYDDVDGELVPVTSATIVTVDNKTIISKPTLEDSDPTSLYIRIFAKDSMYSPTEGFVYETIFVTIETGKLNSPYLIENADELQAIKNAPTKHYMLKADVDLSGRNWEPIENFSGSLNGIYYRKTGEDIFAENHKITGLTLNSTDGVNVGLFGDTTITSLIFNVELEITAALVSNNNNLETVGALVGSNKGVILNCAVSLGNGFIVEASSTDTIGSTINVGGMVGANYGWVHNFAPFAINNNGEFTRQYTAEEVEDLSVPDGYHEIVGASDSFLTVGMKYSQGAIPSSHSESESIDMAEVNMVIDALTSANPVSGRLIIRDSAVCAVNYGGLVGYNEGFINGVYGLYHAQEESSSLAGGTEEENQFLISNTLSASFNSEGKDVSASIGPSGASLSNSATTAGGIVGKSVGGRIHNVAASGKVEGLYNVGGIIGRTESGTVIDTASSCARITGFESVGGAIGYARGAFINLVKVENYQETIVGGDILINANHNVGGVVGFMEATTMTFAYAVSFVEQSTFTLGLTDANKKADIYNNGNQIKMYVGGVVGHLSHNSHLQFVYSTMSIYTSKAEDGSFAGGIAGAMEQSATIFDTYYLGNFVQVPAGKTGSVVGLLNATGSTPSVADNVIRFFFATTFESVVGRDANGFFNTSDTTVIKNIMTQNNLTAFVPTSTANWEIGTSLNIKNNIKFPVIKYTSNLLERDVYFIKQTPTAVSAKVAASGSDDRFIKIKDTVLLLTHSANPTNNEYKIKDLLKFTWEPSSIKSSSLRVSSSAINIVEVKEDGVLLVKESGTVTLTFTSVLNLNASCSITVVVVPKVTEVALYSDSNLTTNLLRAGAMLEIKKGSNQKLFPTFYDIDKNGKRIKVNTGYFVEYTLADATVTPEAISNAFVSISKITDIITALKETETPQVVSFLTYMNVNYAIDGVAQTPYVYNPFSTYPESGKKSFEISIYTGATDLVISPNSGKEITAYAPEQLEIDLVSDAKVDGVNLEIIDDNGNIVRKQGTSVEINKSGQYYSIIGADSEGQQKLDEIGFMFDINYIETYFPMGVDSGYNATLYLKINENKKYYKQTFGYTFRFSAVTNPALSRDIRVVVIPQVVLTIEDNYKVLEGTEISSTGANSYIFQEKPVDKIVPGKLGLISINVFPDYAGVEYYKIHTTAEAMPYINFAQLYKDKSVGSSGMSYIFGTNAVPIENGLRLNRLSNFLRTEYTLSNGVVTGSVDEVLEDSNNTLDIIKIDNVYEFDGNLYVELLTSNTIYELEKFPVWVTAVYADGTELVYEREFETTYLPALTFETTRDYIALGTRETKSGGLEKDYVDIEAIVDGDYDVSMDYTIIKHGVNTGTEGVASFRETDKRKGRVILSQNAQAGDKIRITASYTIIVEGRMETVSASTDILVVDAVIDEYSIEKAVDNKLLFTISSSQQLQATLKGCAEAGVMSRLSTVISRQMTEGNAIAYWKYVYKNGDVTNLDNRALSLPFGLDIKKVSSADDGEGLASISLVGSTVSGSADLMLKAYAYYNNDGNLCFGEMIDEYCLYPTLIEIPFVAQVMVDSTDDLPTPIYTVEELLGMAEGGNYILMKDLDITTPFTPISTNIAGFDGNNKIITISNFAYDSNAESMSSTAINIGLFSTVAGNAVIKNVIVALPNNKENPMMLNNYTNINFGGIAGVNNGIITNCEVISIYEKDVYDSYTGISNDDKKVMMYSHLGYTYNIYTAVQVGGTSVSANIGGLVGQNGATGVITNSRVGRNYVEYVEIQEDDYNGTNPNLQIYEYTAPVTIFKLEGSGNIGGFAGTNEGTISSSYFGNGQLEISSYGSNYTKTGGFVAVNKGAVYSSYVAGWEEEDYLIQNQGSGTGQTQLAKDPNNGGNSYVVSLSLVNPNRKLGGGIYSNGNIGGFVYANTGYIQNCYSNICLNGDYSFAANRHNISSNSTLTEYGNLNAGGFAFSNMDKGSINTSYSISKIKSSISTHGPFIGVNSSSGDVQNGEEAIVNKCYYLIEKNEEIYNENDPAYDISQMNDETMSEEGSEGESEDAVSVGNEFIIKDTFAGFSFDNENYYEGMQSGAVWAMKTLTTISQDGESGQNDYGYPELISANKVAISVRVLKPNSDTMDGDADYSYIYALGYEKGSDINPQIITSASDYNKVFENILNVTVPFENVNVKYTGNLRLVNNIDFSALTPASSSFEFTSPINGKSVFDGNNLAISNILLGDDSESNTAFGLFKVLNGVGVKNITLTIRAVDSTNGVAVGGLAGIAVESDINNINIGAAVEGAEVSGQNYVGGLAGIIVSGDDYNLHYINNINVNVSVLASYNGLNSQNIIKSGEIWSLIIPPARINPYSSDYNLRLQYLKKNVSYAGGIAGAIDLKQAFFSDGEDAASDSLDNVNARALSVAQLKTYIMSSVTLHSDNATSVEAEYAGGLFGFVGEETFIREASFEAYTKSEVHYIMGDVAAGGITAINYGFIDQTEVTYDKDTQQSLDKYLEDFVKGTNNITWGNQHLYTGSPTYLGGIAGINIGGMKKNTGTIQNSYNRIDLINESSTRIGGIAGASHVGAFVNVYTTANIVGNFEEEVSYFGSIVGQLLNNENNKYYSVSLERDKEPAYNLEFTNISVATIWNPEYFELYEAYTNTYGIETYEVYRTGEMNSDVNVDEEGNETLVEAPNTATIAGQFKLRNGKKIIERKGRIGAVYGAPTSADVLYTSDDTHKYNPYPYYDFYVVEFNGDNVILQTEIYENFSADGKAIDLFCGVQSINKADPTLSADEVGCLHYYLSYDPDTVASHTLNKAEMNDLYTLEVGTTSNAKEKAFSQKYWSSRIWNFEETERLISLNFGYIPSVARIYTADDFIKEIQDSPGSKKYYYIMNDIDFSSKSAHEIYVASNFRGTIVGVKQWNEAKTSSRYPILYNIRLSDESMAGSFNSEKIAMFHNTTNASFFNLNIVISGWNEYFPQEGDTERAQFVKRTSVLIASANTTTVNNVHIGYRLSHFTSGFLTAGNAGASFIHDATAGGITNEEYLNLDLGYDSDTDGVGPDTDESFKGIKTYGTYYGGIIADGLSSSVKNCSFNIPAEVIYQNELLPRDTELFAGGISGKILGTIAQSFVTRNFAVYTEEKTTNARNIYVGGVVGYIAGLANNVGFGNPEANLSSSFITNWRNSFSGENPTTDRGNLVVKPTTSSIVTGSNASGYLIATNEIYIGGVVGLATEIIDATASLDSKVDSLYNYNTKITVETEGKVNVGGVIGRNDVQATWLQYKNKTLNTLGVEVNANHNVDSVNVGGIVGNNASNTVFSQVYTNVNTLVTKKQSNNAIVYVGGVVGLATQNFTFNSVLNEAYGLEVDANTGTFYVGGILGASTSNAATNIRLDYVISTAYIQMKENSGVKTVYVGGLIGYVKNSGITIVNAASLGNVYIDRSTAISALRAGGLVGEAKMIDLAENANGLVVAANVNYTNIGSAASFKIGQIAGNLTQSSLSEYDKMYFSENLFGLYLNDYYKKTATGSSDTNLNMEDLAAKFSFIFIQNTAGDFGSYLQEFKSGASQTYASKLSSLIMFDDTTKTFVGVLGSKLNPKELTNANVSELETTTYTYYKMSADIDKTSGRNTEISDVNISSPMESLGRGNFIDARGHSIIVNTNTTSKVSTNFIFESIEEEAFVVGLLVAQADMNNNNGRYGAIAQTNHGTILGCGSATVETKSIYGKQVAGIVHTNTGNVINCFSIATIKAQASGQAAGLVFNNSGNIITSYYTGNLEHSSSNNNLGGFVYKNSGNITNSYTMANIINAEHATLTGALYVENDSGSLINVYYDINAYVGTAVSYSSLGKTTAELSKLGVSGEGPTIAGNWFISDNNDMKKLYKKAYNDGDANIHITSAWFNYSYSVANVNGNIPTVSGIRRFMQMIYTGNGKKADGGYTNNFYNGPFRITNAGMIESYFMTANGQTADKKSYYILQNDISFKSYSEWSETWNRATASPILFTGDFDGNGKLMHTIVSSKYGIFRNLGAGANIYNFTISNIKSQTALIAGGMDAGATIDNVTISSKTGTTNHNICRVDNEDVTELKLSSGTSASSYLYKDLSLGSIVIAYQKGGEIKRVNIQGSIDISSSSYAGGIVAYATGGTIDLSGTNAENYNPFTSCSVEITSNVVGGMIGHSEIAITNYTLNNNIELLGARTAGGFIGETDKKSLIYLKLNNNGVVMNTSSSSQGGIIGEIKQNLETVTLDQCTNKSSLNAGAYAGGLVGKATYIELKNSINTAGVSISADYAGGLVGSALNSIELKDSSIGEINSGVTISATTAAGGVVGSMTNGEISGKTTSSLKSLASINCGEHSGNIVGTITTTEDSSTQVDSSLKNGVLIAYVIADISNIKSTVYNSYTNFGGVVGYAKALNASSIKINNISVIGTVASYASNFGGVVGRLESFVMIDTIEVDMTATIAVSNSNSGGVVGFVDKSNTSYYVVSGVGQTGNYSEVTFVVNVSTTNIRVGGVVGYSTGMKLQTSYIVADIASASGVNSYVGGIVGHMIDSSVDNVKALIYEVSNKSISTDSTALVAYAGGIVGYMETSSLENTETLFDDANYISGTYAGGAVGVADDSSFANINVENTDSVAAYIYGRLSGGIIGYGTDIEFATGNFTVKGEIEIHSNYLYGSNPSHLGGIAGEIELSQDITSLTKFSSTADIIGNTYTYAGGIFGYFKGGKIEGVVSSKKTTNLIVNGKVKGTSIGYLVGYAASIDSTNPINITNISIPSNTVTDTINFALEPLNSASVGGIIGTVKATRDSIISKFSNYRNYTFNAAIWPEMYVFGTMIGSIYSQSSATVSITEFINEGNISKDTDVTSSSFATVGGLIGLASADTTAYINIDGSSGTSKQIKNIGSINVDTSNAGGIVGEAYNINIIDPVSTGAITNGAMGFVGGIVSYAGGPVSITTTKALTIRSGDIVTTGDYAGGVIGYAGDTYTIKGYSSPDKRITVTGKITSEYSAGGIVGYTYVGTGTSLIENVNCSASTAELSVTAYRSGGVVGYITNTDKLTIKNVDLIQKVFVYADESAGGVVGYVYSTLGVTIDTVKVSDATISLIDTYLTCAGGIIGEMSGSVATITNSSVKSSRITSSFYAGGLVGYIYGGYLKTYTSVTSDDNDITSYYAAGGIAGSVSLITSDNSFSGTSSKNNTIISDIFAGGMFGECYLGSYQYTNFGVTIESNTMTAPYAGVVMASLEGWNYDSTKITMSSTSIKSNVIEGEYLGAIAYLYDIHLYNLDIDNGNTTTYKGADAYYIGGIAGYANEARVDDCDSYTAVSASSDADYCKIGGIVGYADDSIIKDSSHGGGTVKPRSTYSAKYSYAGGIVGYSSGYIEIRDSDNTGAVYAGYIAGGIIGYVSSPSSGSILYDSDNWEGSDIKVSNQSGSNQELSVGGIVGTTSGGSITLDYCHNYSNVTGYYRNTDYQTTTFYSNGSGASGQFKWNLTQDSYNNHGLRCFVGGIIGFLGSSTSISYTRCYVQASDISAYIDYSTSSLYAAGICHADYYHDGTIGWAWGSVTVDITVWSGAIAGCGQGANMDGCTYDSSALNPRSKLSGKAGRYYTDAYQKWDWVWYTKKEGAYKDTFSSIINSRYSS